MHSTSVHNEKGKARKNNHTMNTHHGEKYDDGNSQGPSNPPPYDRSGLAIETENSFVGDDKTHEEERNQKNSTSKFTKDIET